MRLSDPLRALIQAVAPHTCAPLIWLPICVHIRMIRRSPFGVRIRIVESDFGPTNIFAATLFRVTRHPRTESPRSWPQMHRIHWVIIRSQDFTNVHMEDAVIYFPSVNTCGSMSEKRMLTFCQGSFHMLVNTRVAISDLLPIQRDNIICVCMRREGINASCRTHLHLHRAILPIR